MEQKQKFRLSNLKLKKISGALHDFFKEVDDNALLDPTKRFLLQSTIPDSKASRVIEI